MERAVHPPEVAEHVRPAPVPRDPDLPTVSDTTLMLFAAAALVLTAFALFGLTG